MSEPHSNPSTHDPPRTDMISPKADMNSSLTVRVGSTSNSCSRQAGRTQAGREARRGVADGEQWHTGHGRAVAASAAKHRRLLQTQDLSGITASRQAGRQAAPATHQLTTQHPPVS